VSTPARIPEAGRVFGGADAALLERSFAPPDAGDAGQWRRRRESDRQRATAAERRPQLGRERGALLRSPGTLGQKRRYLADRVFATTGRARSGARMGEEHGFEADSRRSRR